MTRGKPTRMRRLTGNLDRHKRTHDRPEGGAEGSSYNLSGEDEEDYSGEDQLGSVEEASPTSENAYAHTSLNAVANNSAGNSNGMSPPTSVPSGPSYNSLQTLSMPMTMSTPQTVNTGPMI